MININSLSNNNYIREIMSSLKYNPKIWNVSPVGKMKLYDTEFHKCMKDISYLDYCTIRRELQSLVPNNQMSHTIMVAMGAILGLLTYKDYAYLLESDTSEVEMLAKLGVPAAILMLPACRCFNQLKELA